MTQPITVIAQIDIKPQDSALVLEALTNAVKATRLENGCESYELYQDADVAHRWVLIERWRDETALTAHIAGPVFVTLSMLLDGKAELQVSKLSARPI